MVKFDSPLWTRYQKACNDYLKKFCEKHDFDYEDATDSWVSNFAGTIVECGDYFFSLETIILDIENNVPEEEIFKWYDYCLENGEKSPNYQSWLMGYSTDHLESKSVQNDLKSGKNDKLEKLREEFNRYIDELERQEI